MTRYFLTRLQIEGFRGINNEGDPLDLRFKPNAVNSIFAANGLGKSSIFDALSYAIRGCIPKLDRLQAVEQAQDYYANHFHSTRTAVICLTLTSGDGGADVTIRVERSPTGSCTVTSPSGHSDPSHFLQSLNEDHVLLDYQTFTKFMEDTPLARGRSFSSLLGMAKLSEFRQVLEVLSHGGTLKRDFQMDQLEQAFKVSQEEILTSLRTIRSNYEKILGAKLPEPFAPASIVETVTDVLAAIPLLKNSFADKDIMTVNFGQIRDTIKQAENSQARERLTQIIRWISSLDELAPASHENDERVELLRLIQERDNCLLETRGPLFKTLYEAVKAILESNEWGNPVLCPACESTPSIAPSDFVAERLAQYDTVSEKQRGILQLWKTALFVKRISKLEAHDALGPPDNEKQFADLDRLFRLHLPSATNARNVYEILDNLEKKRQSTLQTLKLEKENIEKSLPQSLVTLTEQVEYAQGLRDALNNHQRHAKQALAVTDKFLLRTRWMDFIEKACEMFSKADASFSQARAQAMRAQYQAAYARLMSHTDIIPILAKRPGEEHLYLKLEKFFSLNDTSAVTLLSESYRNALAISIFLGAALGSLTIPRFIVLDDVTSSFDAGHQFNLMEFIRTEIALPDNPNGLQIIILSHDGLLEKYFDKLSGSPAWHHQRLQGLPPMGSVLSEAQNADRLRVNAERFLNAGQGKQAEPLIRQYLEYKLLQLISKVRIPVPLDFAIRDHLHMVSNCLDIIDQAVQLHTKAGILILPPSCVGALQSTHVPALIANWVNHYETASGSSLSPYVLLGVLKAVDDFVDSFCYDCVCDGPKRRRYYRSLSAKYCKC